jgi:lipopolysaccharide assembly LptE-like protein
MNSNDALRIENCQLPIANCGRSRRTICNLQFAICNLSVIRLVVLLTLIAITSLSGCGYMVGSANDPQIRTVEVPVFETNSYRRGIELQLTEAVQKQIQLRTPFRVVTDGGDTRLTGRIMDVRKSVLGETQFDDPRELQINLALEVVWEDLRAGRVLSQEQIPLTPELSALRAQSEFAPEVGHSLATAMQQAVNRLARQVVDRMEAPW